MTPMKSAVLATWQLQGPIQHVALRHSHATALGVEIYGAHVTLIGFLLEEE